MKIKHYIKPLLICALMATSCGTTGKTSEATKINNFSALSAQFAQPSKEFGSVPLYVWNNDVTIEQIDRTMADLKQKGFGGVFVHPRPGMVTEYLSPKWFELFRHTLDKGKELDMNVWIYDENSYPSGFAGGRVNEAMPESYNEGVALRYTKVEMLPDSASKFFMCLKNEGGKFRDITDNLTVEAGKKGDYYLFSKAYNPTSPWYGGFSYVDLLHKGVTQKFIEITLDGYAKIAGDDFGKSVPGWFTDEPQITVTDKTTIRWTPDLFAEFQKQWGYDLKTNIVSLWEEVGNWKTVRHNYRQTLLYMFVDRFAKPCFEYCKENNLIFTGHYWEHGWPDMAHNSDNMAMYQWHQMPGIDLLYNKYMEDNPNAHFGNVRSVKEINSAANQMGYNRKLSESYGGGGWDETLEDFKRLGDWEYALGINFMNQHIAPLSIAGSRKYDYPPTFTDHSPWWKYYTQINMHFARLSLALSSGEQYNDILVLEPTTSIWLYYFYNDAAKNHWREIGEDFQLFITKLEKSQVEFDLGSENIIKNHGKVSGNKFVVGKREYSTVVIPAMNENLDSSTFALLKKFAKSGGKIIAYSTPTHVDGAENKEVQLFFSDTNNVTLEPSTKEPRLELFASDKIEFNNTNGSKLFHHRRVTADGQILFLTNSSKDEYQQGSVIVKGKDAVMLNTLTGEMFDYPQQQHGDNIKIDYNMPPVGSLLLYIFDKSQSGFKPLVEGVNYQPIAAQAEVKVVPEVPNVLAIDFCDLTLDKETFTDMHTYDAADKAYKHNGFKNGNPWSTSVQFKNEIISRDTFSTGGFKVAYNFYVNGNFDMTKMEVAIERPELYKIMLNGKSIDPKSDKWWIDREMKVLPIGSLIKQGPNVLTLEASPMRVMAEIEPIHILGNFKLISAKKGWIIEAPATQLKLGSWKAQGWPFYPCTVSYTKSFDVADKNNFYKVALGQWNGTVCEVLVNGTSAGIIFAQPYSIDVSPLIKNGINTVEVKVVGSNYNLMGPLHTDHTGRVAPRFWRGVKEYPAGDQYVQFDYGLMTDFDLTTSK